MVAPSRHPEVHELAASGAAEAALLGLGLEKDAEILSRIVEEKTKPEGNRDEGLLAHLYFARGMVNWYLERPLIAAEMFREVAERRRKRGQVVQRFRAVVNQMLSLAQAGQKPDRKLLVGLPFDRRGLHEQYLSGLAYEAMGNTEKAIATWFKLLEPQKTQKKTPVAKPETPARPRLLIDSLDQLLEDLRGRLWEEPHEREITPAEEAETPAKPRSLIESLDQLMEGLRHRLRERIREEEARKDRYSDLVDYLNFASSKFNQLINRPRDADEDLQKVEDRQAVESLVGEMARRAQAKEEMLPSEASSAMHYLIGPAYLEINDSGAAIRAMITSDRAIAEGVPEPVLPKQTVAAVRKGAAEALASALVKQGRIYIAKEVWKKHLAGAEVES